eukprot:1140961-Pelagomonas_calceolata.AAC.4
MFAQDVPLPLCLILSALIAVWVSEERLRLLPYLEAALSCHRHACGVFVVALNMQENNDGSGQSCSPATLVNLLGPQASFLLLSSSIAALASGCTPTSWSGTQIATLQQSSFKWEKRVYAVATFQNAMPALSAGGQGDDGVGVGVRKKAL